MSVFSWLPGLQAVRSYRREWLAKDVIAGIVLTTLLVPQGMAYAELAGLPPITGLYTSIMCRREQGIHGITAFAGFEAAAALSEEARNTRASATSSGSGGICSSRRRPPS
jgi:MFS superfamily sulfate permease-like transporter